MANKKDIFVAYHEAGHAIIAWHLLGLKRIKSITIIPDADYLGCLKTKKVNKKDEFEICAGSLSEEMKIESKMMRLVMESFAGNIAEKKIRKRNNWVGANKDLNSAVEMLSRITGNVEDKEFDYLQKYLYRKTENLIDFYWKEVETIANELLEKKTINEDEFLEAIRKSKGLPKKAGFRL